MLLRQYYGSSNADSETFQTFNSLNIILTDQPHALRSSAAKSGHAALTILPRAGLMETLCPTFGYP